MTCSAVVLGEESGLLPAVGGESLSHGLCCSFPGSTRLERLQVGHRPADSWQLGTGLRLISLVILVSTRWPVSLSQALEELSEWPGEGSKVGQGS